MSQSFKIGIVAVILLGLTHFSAFAQDDAAVQGLNDYSGSWWVNIGAGSGFAFGYDQDELGSDLSTGDDDSGFALSTSVNYALSKHQLLTLRYSHVQLGALLDFDVEHEKKIDGVYDIGLLYGLMHKTDLFLASVAAGLAYTAIESHTSELVDLGNGNYTSESHHSTESTVGVPVEVQLFWTPTRYFGLGVIGLANFNSEASYAAGLLAIQLGNLK